MSVAVSFLVEGQGSISISLSASPPGTIGFNALDALSGGSALSTGSGSGIIQIIVVWIKALWTISHFLPASQQFLLGDLNERVSSAASVLVELSRGSDGGGATGDRPLGAPGGHGSGGAVVGASISLQLGTELGFPLDVRPGSHVTRLRSRAFALTTGPRSGVDALAVDLLLVLGLDALGTCRHEDLPATPHALGGHLDAGVVVAAAELVEGGVEFDVHVSPGPSGLLERVSLAVHGAAPLLNALAAQRGDPSRLVGGRAALGAVHLDFLPQQLAVLLHLLGQLHSWVRHAGSVLVKGGAGKGRPGTWPIGRNRGRHGLGGGGGGS